MNLFLYTHDLGPARNLARVVNAAFDRGHRVIFVENQPLPKIDLEEMNLVIIGLSSFQNEDEIRLLEWCKQRGVPCLVVADTHYAWARPAAKGKVDQAIAIVASPVEIQEARAWGYKDAVYLGGPPLWADWRNNNSRFPEISDKKVVLVGGVKSPVRTDHLLLPVIEFLQGHPEWQLIFKPHPNEAIAEDGWDPTIRQAALAKVRLIDADEKTDDLVPRVNLVIQMAGSTNSIQAAIIRIPVINLHDEAVKASLLKQIGREDWPPLESGAIAAATADNLEQVIEKVISPRGIDQQRWKQLDTYPGKTPQPETVIIEFAEKMLK